MKKNLSELVFILDKSGSMYGFEADTVGGFNSMIEKQKGEEGDAFVTTYLFSNDVKMLHDRIPLDKIEPLKVERFCVGGSTALYDAIGAAIDQVELIHKYARKDDVPEHTIFVISTDGLENASRIYSHKRVRSMIERKEKEEGWEFIFLGANIDVAAVSSGLGITSALEVPVCEDGIEKAYCMMSEAISSRRRSPKDIK